MEFATSMSGYAHKFLDAYPQHVKLQVMNEIRCFLTVLKRAHREIAFDLQEEEDDDDEQEEDEWDGEDKGVDATVSPDQFTMNDAVWAAIEASVLQHQELKMKHNNLQLQLPSDRTAPIARFNREAHFTFESEAAITSTPPLTRALVRCELRELPPLGGVAYARVRRPLVYDYPDGAERVVDMDGDMIAACGPNVACMPVPCFVNLEEAKKEYELKDKSAGTFPTDSWRTLYESKRPDRYFASCIADPGNDRVWVVSGWDDKIRGFSNAADLSEGSDRQLALLSFAEREKLAQRRFVNPSYTVTRMGDYLVGSRKTPRLSLWKMQDAVNEYGERKPSTSATSSSKEESSDEEEKHNERKKHAKREAYAGLSPSFVQVEKDSTGFACGDVQWIGGSNLLVAAARSVERQDISIRLFDVEAEKVVGLFCGIKGYQSVERQHCFDHFHSVFFSDTHPSYVYDARTCQPSITLNTRHSEGQVLGVPGESAMAAFTFSHRDAEAIQCWDLRMPASHAYSMWTGNNDIKALFWHEPTTSLLAATKSSHTLFYGRRIGAYRYGEPVDEFADDSDWPAQAVHDPFYFGDDRKICYHFEHPAIIQYAFDNGMPMGRPMGRLKTVE